MQLISRYLSTELDKLSVSFAVNKVILNVSNTNFMVFGNKAKKHNATSKHQNCNITRVYVTKFLGILIDDRLNRKERNY